jgi:hypothetical protein
MPDHAASGALLSMLSRPAWSASVPTEPVIRKSSEAPVRNNFVILFVYN